MILRVMLAACWRLVRRLCTVLRLGRRLRHLAQEELRVLADRLLRAAPVIYLLGRTLSSEI